MQSENIGIVGLAQARGGFHEGVEYWLQVEGRSADDLEHVARRGLVLERLLEIAGALPQFAQEPRILNGDDCLRREIFNKGYLFLGEWTHLPARGDDLAQQEILPAQRDKEDGPDAALSDPACASYRILDLR